MLSLTNTTIRLIQLELHKDAIIFTLQTSAIVPVLFGKDPSFPQLSERRFYSARNVTLSSYHCFISVTNEMEDNPILLKRIWPLMIL